jgi:lichenan operon transcriptional antiterminator
MAPFTLHLSNMIWRMRHEITVANPIAAQVRRSLPIIYDIAVFSSLKVKKHTGKMPDEGETAFIALHIGAELERQRGDKEKLSAALIAHNYQGSLDWALKELGSRFSDEITVTRVAEQEEDIQPGKYDLVITMLGGSRLPDAIPLTPVCPLDKDPSLRARIEKIKKGKKVQILRNYFDRFFDPGIFFVDEEGKMDRNQCIACLCEALRSNGYVDESFFGKVMERERAGATAFRNIAIPHSMETDAYKTAVAILISRGGVRWGEKLVNITALLTVNVLDKDMFRDLYGALTELFFDETWVEKASRAHSFSQFKETVACSFEI